MPTLHWWIGASSVSPLVMTVTWRILSNVITNRMPTSFPHIVLAKLLLSQLLQNYCCYRYYYCYYYCYCYQTTILLCYWSLCYRYLVSRCGWIDNSTANTCKYSLAPLCRINKFGLNTIPSKTVAIPIHVGYQDLFLAPLPGSIALFAESVGIYICW